ncbi:MAG: PhzF family phenazine biosynthesis protein [Prevotella sp.]|nr:PhzF family phenazine biosynthesis protein [Prevotella sp.]
MKQYRYVKSNAFTSGSIPEQSSPTRSLSLGNPAACIFMGQEELSPEQMQAIAAEHKGFVMEVVFCGPNSAIWKTLQQALAIVLSPTIC